MSDLMLPPRSDRENLEWIADFAELQCLLRDDRSVSDIEISRIISRASLDDDRAEIDVDVNVRDAFSEIENRISHVGRTRGAYPFSLEDDGRLLVLRGTPTGSARRSTPEVYLFLLLATRLNMRSQREQSGHDGTMLFEELCLHVAEKFWGGRERRTRSMLFGTSRRSSDEQRGASGNELAFGKRVQALCHKLGEGERYSPPDDVVPVRAQDDKLDLIVWRGFSDRRSGQLIGFGQCKTGTSWRNSTTDLQPDDWFRTWTARQPVISPVRMLFVAERVVRRWEQIGRQAGILFDRCRIVEWSIRPPEGILKRIKEWVAGVARSHDLKLP